MCPDNSKMLVFGQNCTTRFTLVSEYSGKVSNKMEQGLRQKIAKVEQLHQSNQKTTGNSVMWRKRLQIANLVYSKMHHFQVTCGITHQRQEGYFACVDHTVVSISCMCQKQTAVSHSSAESEILSLDEGLRMDGLPSLQFWEFA